MNLIVERSELYGLLAEVVKKRPRFRLVLTGSGVVCIKQQKAEFLLLNSVW